MNSTCLNPLSRLMGYAALMAVLTACQKAPEPPVAPTTGATNPPAASPTPGSPSIQSFVSTAPVAGNEIPQGGNCSLDMVLGQAALADNPVPNRQLPLVLAGWGAAEIEGKFPAQTHVALTGLQSKTLWFAPTERNKRPDVAVALKNPNFDDAGFGLAANIAPLPTDTYQVSIVLVLNGKALMCDTGKRIQLN